MADAGEDISLQNILEEQRRAVDDSIMGSVAERTDNIINYSGALNTSEEFIENTVNASGTLGPINPYSIVSSASKPIGSIVSKVKATQSPGTNSKPQSSLHQQQAHSSASQNSKYVQAKAP